MKKNKLPDNLQNTGFTFNCKLFICFNWINNITASLDNVLLVPEKLYHMVPRIYTNKINSKYFCFSYKILLFHQQKILQVLEILNLLRHSVWKYPSTKYHKCIIKAQQNLDTIWYFYGYKSAKPQLGKKQIANIDVALPAIRVVEALWNVTFLAIM